MKTSREQTLTVLDAVVQHSNASQRRLAVETGLNLAKVNQILRRLVDEQLIATSRTSELSNGTRLLYTLTDAGWVMRSHLTLDIAGRIWDDYRKTLGKFSRRLEILKEAGHRNFALIGATKIASMVLEAAKDVPDIKCVGIVAPKSETTNLYNVPVVEDRAALDFDMAIVCHLPGSSIDFDPSGQDHTFWPA